MKSSLLPAVTLLTLFSFNLSFAQTAGQCIDTDGDGYGWNGIETCTPGATVAVNTGTQTGCDYSDADLYDGWGWNETTRQSCAPTGTTVTQSQELSCVDSDGDGYGWDGAATCLITQETTNCVDTDGDGYGWDGVQTCLVTQDIENNAADIPYFNRYETSTLATWPAIESADAMWPPFGAPVVEATNGWTMVRNHPLPHVVICENHDNTIEDTSNPGFFYDPAKGQTCAKSGTVMIPAPDPVEFTKIGAEVLYENGNQWNCRFESRPSMDTEFEPNGSTRTLTYESPGGDYLPEHTLGYGYGSPKLSYKDNMLTRYITGLSREVCNRVVVRNFPFTNYGDDKAALYRSMWNAFIGTGTPLTMRSNRPDGLPVSELSKAPTDQLVDRPLQCARLSEHRSARGGTGHSFSALEKSVTIETVGNNEYKISGFPLEYSTPDQVWSAIAEGVFSGYPMLAFYRYTDTQSILYTNWGGPAGSSTQTTQTFYACEAL